MRMTTNGFSLEHEDLGSVSYPKQRFVDPVRVGIFFYGFSPEDEEMFPTTRAEEKEDRVTGVTTDIYFEGGPPMLEPRDEIFAGQTPLQPWTRSQARDHPNSCCCRQARLQDLGRTGRFEMRFLHTLVQDSEAAYLLHIHHGEIFRRFWRPSAG